MKKTKILTVLGVILAMGLTGCKTGNKSSSTEPAKSSEQPASQQSSEAGQQSSSGGGQASSSSQAPAPHVHDFKAGPQYPLYEGTTAVDYVECACGVNALQWDANDYDAETQKVEKGTGANAGGFRFASSSQTKANSANDGITVNGKLVYKIYVQKAVEHAGLDFYIQAHNQNVAIFDAVSGDSGAGKDFVNNEVVDATKRYALYVNDERIQLGEDPGASSEKAWFSWPVDFKLKQGENKIEIDNMGGYRAYFFNFRVTGVAKYAPFAQYDAKLSETAAGEGFIKTEMRADTYNSGLRALTWSALDYDQTKTAARSDEGKGPESRDEGKAIRFSSTANGSNTDHTAKGTHIVYNVKVPEALTKVGLSVYSARRTDIATIFDKNENDSSKGYEMVGTEYVRPDSRYGLKIDGKVVLVNKDESGQAWHDGLYWYHMPVELTLTAGIHEIEIYNLGGYRVEFYNFALSGLPAAAGSTFTLGNEWKSDETGHWKEVAGQEGVKFMFFEHRYVVTKDTQSSTTAAGEHIEKCSICGKEVKTTNPILSFKEYVKADLTAAIPNASKLTSTTYENEIVGYKWNNATNAIANFTYEADAAKTVTFRLLLSPKKGNEAATGFWRQGTTAKTKVTVNTTEVTAPEKDVDFTVCKTESASGKDGNSVMMQPAWFDIANVELQQGTNTITVAFLTGGYGYYLCGGALANYVAPAQA